eukprot:364775-Chlamydomonas_euryale.AAC.8
MCVTGFPSACHLPFSLLFSAAHPTCPTSSPSPSFSVLPIQHEPLPAWPRGRSGAATRAAGKQRHPGEAGGLPPCSFVGPGGARWGQVGPVDIDAGQVLNTALQGRLRRAQTPIFKI